MTTSHSVDVLVVGAGPTGLTVAGDLARAGRSVTVLERWPTVNPSSRGFATMARTLEVLDARGLADDLLSMLANIFLVLPALPLLIVIFGFLGKGASPNDLVIGVIISVTGWAFGARQLRAQTLSMRNRDFVDSARIIGEKSWRIMGFEILPNLIPVVATSFLFTVIYGVGTYTALSFLGVINTSHWSWGTMLYWAQSAQAAQQVHLEWWWFVPPGLAVALIGTALVLLNTGIDELGNPRLRDASSASRIAGRWLKPADPTPVLSEIPQRRNGFAGFLHSFSRSSLLDKAEAGERR